MKKIILLLTIIVGTVLISCNQDDTTDPNVVESESFLEVESLKILRGQQLEFQLLDTANINNTSKATFYIDGNAIIGNSFSSSSEGTFELFAEYNLAGTITRTAIETIEVFIPKRNVLVEDYTGTWCGYCPRMTTLIEEAQAITEDITIVSIHGNSIYTGVDPFTIPEGMFLKEFFEVPGYPTGVIDRQEFWDQSNMAPQINAAAGLVGPLSIALDSNIEGGNLKVDVKIISEQDMNGLKLVVFVLEDNLIEDQRSYFNTDPTSPYYQMGDILVDFRHDHVLRLVMTDPLGDDVSATAQLEVYQRSFTTTLPSEFDQDSLSIVAIVTNGDNNAAVNSQSAHVGIPKDFD